MALRRSVFLKIITELCRMMKSKALLSASTWALLHLDQTLGFLAYYFNGSVFAFLKWEWLPCSIVLKIKDNPDEIFSSLLSSLVSPITIIVMPYYLQHCYLWQKNVLPLMALCSDLRRDSPWHLVTLFIFPMASLYLSRARDLN